MSDVHFHVPDRVGTAMIARTGRIPGWIGRQHLRLAWSPGWGILSFAPVAGPGFFPAAFMLGALIWLSSEWSGWLVVLIGVYVVLVAVAFAIDTRDKERFRAVVRSVADASAGIDSNDVSGVLVRLTDGSARVALVEGAVDGPIPVGRLIDLDPTATLSGRTGRRVAAIIAASTADQLRRPLLGFFA